MKQIKGFILYRIFYDKDWIIYVGRTKQPLLNRIRGHFFKKPMHRFIDINKVTKIEYSEYQSASDMNVYEVYFINLWKPMINNDDKEQDDLHITLPLVEWKTFDCHLMGKWKKQINDKELAQKIETVRHLEKLNKLRFEHNQLIAKRKEQGRPTLEDWLDE